MDGEINYWELAAGLGLFLFGMHQLEHALTQLAGRSFKKFLRQHTSHPLKGVIAGAATTAALQSSSVVSLIVMAFVGTGIISLASGIAIVFGSNLGTTATGWIVATIGFKLDIAALALPFIAIGGFGVVWSTPGTRRAGFSQLVVGLGLMLMGLGFMKSGAVSATSLFNPEALGVYPPIVFLVVGLLLTALIQSSSATIMITLSALYAGVIPLESAAAVAIGADLGTTITALLGALAGSVLKKRVAASLILFNVVTDIVAFLLLEPLLDFISNVIGISDPLIALVAFHSLFNLIGLVLFIPAVTPLSHWLGRHFRDRDITRLRYLGKEDMAVPEAALENMTRETFRLIDQVASFNQLSLELSPDRSFYDSKDDRHNVRLFEPGANLDACYADIKQLEGEVLEYALQLQTETLEPAAAIRLGQIIPAIRNAVHAAKSVRDTRHDLDKFRNSVHDHFNAYFTMFKDATREFYALLSPLQLADLSELQFSALVELKKRSEELHARMHTAIYRDVGAEHLEEVEISTLLNVNRELYMASRSLLAALSDALLDVESANDFNSIPAAG